MDNLQLAVFLENINKRLQSAINEADSGLPKSTKRLQESHYTGSATTPVLDRENWETRQTGMPMSFSLLIELNESIEAQISTLKGEA